MKIRTTLQFKLGNIAPKEKIISHLGLAVGLSGPINSMISMRGSPPSILLCVLTTFGR